VWENSRDAPNHNREVIRPLDRPVVAHGGIAVLCGNLAPAGAVLKPSAASPQLMRHRGRAVVFENIEHYKTRINDPDLDVDQDSVLVLKGCGPKGYPGMAEVGNMGLPPKLLQRGVTDMVRISDARMSGTAYGTVVLHVSPESAVGGPLALVRDGDTIELDVEQRRLHLDVPEEELARRRSDWRAPVFAARGGYLKLFLEHVEQADTGADFDFLVGCRGHEIARESH
jgi:dihydroxyacid dehydratase/phosphogluconate dehydratase